MRTSVSAGSRARDRRRDETSARMLTVVEQLIGEGHAFSALSVDRLAAAAGIHRSSFYRYYADKTELLQILCREAEEDRVRAGLAIWDLPWDAPRDVFHTAVSRLLEVSWSHRALARAAADAAAVDAVVRREHEQNTARAARYIEGRIREGQRVGAIRPDLDAGPVAGWLVYMTQRGIDSLVLRAEPEKLPALATGLSDLLWRTLFAGVRPERTGAA